MNCHIVGYPLKKPRSVILWNQFFKLKKINIEMTEKEISKEKLKDFIQYVKKDNSFYAMAVTMPYKKIFYKLSRITDDVTKYSKSVNLIVKKNNKLLGFNTDMLSLIKILRKFKKKNILIIGMGGTGEAILNVFKEKYKKTNISVVTSQKKNKQKKIKFFNSISVTAVSEKDLIINCTPLGSSLDKKYTNKTPIRNSLFKHIDKKAVIFDLVYSPQITILSKISKKNKIQYFNGLQMNTMQANMALKIAFFKYFK